LESLLSKHLKKVSDFVVDQNDKIPFIRKSTIFTDETIGSSYMKNICKLLLSDEIYQIYEKLENLDWHSLEIPNDIAVGAFLTAARRAMTSNISQLPLLVAQHTELNNIGLPSYYSINETTISSNTPDLIVYIGTVILLSLHTS
jgi:hypothetical protein